MLAGYGIRPELTMSTYILGISAFYHDSAAALLRDGVIVAAAQEERFTRKKHDSDFPRHAVNYCLGSAGITTKDLAVVAYYEKPFLKFDRLLYSYMATAPLGLTSFCKAIPVWLRDKIWLKDTLREELPEFTGSFIFPEHHQSHAASAFFPSPFQEAAFLTVDGVGEWTTTSFGIGRDNHLQIDQEIRFPHSIGLLYSAFTYYAGFKVNSGEYKLMGLAPYGEPRFRDIILRELIDLKDDGSFRLNMRYFDYASGLKMINRHFEALFGRPARRPESPLTQHDMDVARSIQDVTEEVILRMARHIRKTTGMKNLCLAGGVALNCVANGKILQEGTFERIWVQPAAGDAGGALGAALVAWHQYLDKPRTANGVTDSQHGSYLGPEYSSDEIRSFLDSKKTPYRELTSEEMPGVVADLIAEEKVIGWFQGRMEFGPRALGGRSIIGDARSAEIQHTMNLKIKFRESFRPFAPSVLEEHSHEYFDMADVSPYMLLVAPVQENKRRAPTPKESQLNGIERLWTIRSEVPAVTHVDYSARVQTVGPDHNPVYHKLIKRFHEKHGCPVIVNTSFNVRGEPIVCTPEEAWLCFMRTNMDYLVLGNFLLTKTEQKPLGKDIDWLRQFELD